MKSMRRGGLRCGRARTRKGDPGHGSRPFGSLEVIFIRFESSHPSEEAVRELLHVSVVVLERIVIPLAFHRDTILRACKFVLQTKEILVRFQLRIVFDDRQEVANRSIELAVRRNLLLWRTCGKQGRTRFSNVA